MKVPVYTAQTRMARPSRGPQLSVSASPSGLSQDSRALASFGQELASQSLDLYSRFLGEQRQQQLNDAEVELGLQLASLEDKTRNMSPSQIMGKGPKSFTSQANEKVIKIATSMQDSVVAKRFKNRAKVTLANKSISVNKQARTRQIQASLDAALRVIQQKQDMLASVGPGENKTEHVAARLYLFGSDGEGKKNGQIGIFQQLANRGLIRPDQVFQFEETAKQTIEENQVSRLILNAKQNRDEGAMKKLIEDLLGGQMYPDLSPGKSTTLANQALNLSIAIENEKNSNDKANEAQAAKEVKANTEQNERNLIAQLIEFSETGENKPDLSSVRQQLQDGDIGISVARIVENALANPDIEVDRAATFGILEQARQAETTQEIEDARNKALLLVTDESVELSTLSSVLTILDANAAKNTSSAAAQETQALNRYTRLLNIRFNRDAEAGFKFSGVNRITPEEEAKDRRYFDAHKTFFELATSPNFSAKQAFDLVEQQIEESEKRELPFLALESKLMNDYFPTSPETGAAFFSNPQLLKAAKIEIELNETTSQMQKHLDIETLNQLKNFYKTRAEMEELRQNKTSTGGGGAEALEKSGTGGLIE